MMTTATMTMMVLMGVVFSVWMTRHDNLEVQ